jgi:S-methylmethionine-dependent homocysteine/selenocysteine methylase
MTAADAADYHRPQIRSFASAGADLTTALTLNYSAEAIGIVTAAADVGIPAVISFTVETNGELPSGQTLADAIDDVDEASGAAAAYFMINCAHPDHFLHVFEQDGPWHRVRGIRANASTMSHEELDNAEELDRGDEHRLAGAYTALRQALPGLAVVGGCCGTDLAHLDAISTALA